MKLFLLMALLSQSPKLSADIRREGEKVVLRNSGETPWRHTIIEVNYRYKLARPDVAPGAEVSFTKADLFDWEGKPPSKNFKVQVLKVRTDAGAIEVLP